MRRYPCSIAFASFAFLTLPTAAQTPPPASTEDPDAWLFADSPMEEAQDSTVPVLPSETNETAQARTPRSRLIEEIVVTAQKREETLHDVPISISAFSADMLDARGVSNPQDLPQIVPGLSLGEQAGFTVTYLRGIGSDAFLLADPSVALYIDGVYFPFAHGQAQEFGAIERLEVLKGPQGTLFGRNAVGGAISIVTETPGFSAPAASLQTSYGRFNDLQTKGNANVPLTDNLAFAVSGIYNRADNHREGTSGGKPLPQEVTRGARLRLRWAPLERLDLTLSGFHLEQSGVATMFATNSEPSPVFSALIRPQTGRDGGANDAPTYFDLSNTVFYGHLDFHADRFDVRVIGSDQHVRTNSLYDFDGSPTPLVYFEAFQRADIRTAELQILSNDNSWLADRLQWITGYYYFTSRAGFDPPLKFGAAGTVFDAVNDLLAPILDPLGIPPLLPGTAQGILAADGVLDTDSHAVFAQGTYRLTNRLALTAGIRFQDEKRAIVRSGGKVVTPLGNIPYTDFRGQSDTTRSTNPKVTLEFRPWDGGLAYASYQRAVKSSTFNVVNFLRFTEPEPVLPEKLNAYEVGIKTALFGNTTTLSAAAFYYDLKNLQVQFISLLAGGAVTFENAPAAEVKGIDFDITSQIFPSRLPGLVLTAGGAFLDATFTDYPNGQGFNDLGIYTANNDYSGNRIPRSPKFSGTLGLSQTFLLPRGELELAADYYYNSGFFYLAQNTSFNEEDAYGLLGARISYLHEPWGLRATLFGRNILNERYNYSRFTNDFGGLDAVAPPAVYGIRLNWDF